MVKQLDFRLLSPATREEIFRVAGITDKDREWLRSRGKPVGVLELEDTYKVSRAQQKKAYVLLQAICRWSGYTPLETEKTLTKQMFISSQLPTLADSFSLSDCSREVARLYITYLIDFCLLHDIPCGEPLYKLCEDIPKYVYMSTIHKRCAVCGKKAELHHAQGGTIGMGSNRNKVNHIGRPCLPLCRHHHTELHKVGEKDFLERYMLEPVKVDERIAESYNLHRAKEWA
ncbi:putative HNHc nuclease [Selenomonas sp. AE3005]|uniref:putative HNHc nuclease n=1 Tax=Selenomonas sp. AE3005 TaxID=1485543 RepID=UPI0025FC515B|nr:putative HNHc nuclease [Selenomonas sp. AE3005]